MRRAVREDPLSGFHDSTDCLVRQQCQELGKTRLKVLKVWPQGSLLFLEDPVTMVKERAVVVYVVGAVKLTACD